MLPKIDTFVLITNEGPSMDKRGEHRRRIKHEDEGARERNQNNVSNGVFSTLKPP